MTKDTSKNTAARKKSPPAPKEPVLKEHALSYENYMVSQLASISAEIKTLRENQIEMKSDISDLKVSANATNTKIEKLDTKVTTLEKHLPTIWQILGAFALFSGVIITALKVL